MSLAAGAAAATGAATAAANAAFKYNRANYQWDEGTMRFGRYTVGYNMAQAQTKMYRDDITDMTTLTVSKQDTYHTLGVIFFVLNFQLIMAGRLGVHGPSPPGWLLGLYWTNICVALMFLVTFTWMAMHASARAQAGAAYMRTRHVRLPIPTPQQLDKARTTGNSFEKQRLADMLRIPFVTPAPKEVYKETDPETGTESRTPISDRRMPKWYQDEVKDLHDGAGGSSTLSNPEHFELYRGLQEEWWAYDVYSRIGLFCFMSHWLTSASLYSMCHVFGELRCIWPAWSVTACFVAAHHGILKLDIVNPRHSMLSLQVEKVVPFVPFIAVAGMTIDYSVITPTVFWQSAIYVLAWICYAIQFAWAIRLYSLAAPQRQKELPEVPGKPWVPSEWPLPPAFQDAVYVVAAPKAVEQPCLLQEMNAAKGVEGKHAAVKKGQVAEPSLFAWKMFRGALITSIAMWSLIIVGRAFEQVNGERMLLKQEGRVERWPSHMQPWVPPWSRKGTRNEYCHAGGCDRRLSGAEGHVVTRAEQLMSILGPVAAALEGARKGEQAAMKNLEPGVAAAVAWPTGFQPTHLASHSDTVVALAQDLRGVVMQAAEPSNIKARAKDFVSFELEGISGYGEIIGVSLAETGLVVTTSSGALAECLGLPVTDGVWFCKALEVRLPVAGSALKSAVASRVAGSLRAALALQEEGEEDSLLLLDADRDGAGWIPAGEVRAPTARGRALHLSMSPSADELLISADNGEVLKWPLAGDGQMQRIVAAEPYAVGRHAACHLGAHHVAHLARRAGPAPEFFVHLAKM